MALVIGFRGARAAGRENTLEGIRAQARNGADYVHIDVRPCRSGELILMHDESVDRTTNGCGRVNEMTLEELIALDLNGERIPTLKEASILSRDLKVGLVVELMEEGCEEMLLESGLDKEAIVVSFYHASLRELKELSDIKTGIMISSLPLKPVELARWAKADSIFPERTDPLLFKNAHRHGLKVYPWTINTREKAAWLLRLGADGIVTDEPKLIREEANLPIKATGKENCEYYPCHHFPSQDCRNCFCPLYPCKDPELGKFVKTRTGKRFWTCINCRLVHDRDVANYLEKHPEAAIIELKSIHRASLD